MEEREDIPFLSRLVREKALTQKEANAWVRLPLFNIPDSGASEEWDRYQDKFRGKVDNLHSDQIHRCFDEFLCLILNDEGTSGGLSRITFNEHTVDVLYFTLDKEIARVDLTVKWKEFYDRVDIVKVLVNGHDRTRLARDHKGVLNLQLKLGGEPDFPTIVAKLFINSVYKSLTFMMYNDDLDRHAFKCEPKNRPKINGMSDRKTQLRHHAGPRVIYLDRPLYESDKSGTSRTVKYHERAGYRKTLKADRFKNHPLYMVDKAIKVKSAWVGEETFEYKGATYTLMKTSRSEVENE